MTDIKIASWNVGSVHTDTSQEKLLLSLVSEMGVDILCLQELPEDNDLFRRIGEAGNFESHRFLCCSESHMGEHRNMGIALFSKDPVSDPAVIRLMKPYPVLINKNGKAEQIHDKYFFAVTTFGLTIVTGHGYPAIRYCRPELTYGDYMKNDWPTYCIHGKEYSEIFAQIEDWVLSVSPLRTKTLLVGDFNVDSPLSLMPRMQKSHFDVFDGIMTRPIEVMGFEYKTDAILAPIGTTVAEKRVLDKGLDHFAISAHLVLPS